MHYATPRETFEARIAVCGIVGLPITGVRWALDPDGRGLAQMTLLSGIHRCFGPEP